MAIDLNFEIPTSGLDDLFSTQASREDDKREKIQLIPFDLIDDFESHPFKVRMDDEMRRMIESVKEFGILMPVLLRPKDGGRYEMVSGHRRKFAGREAGLAEAPAIIRNLSDEESTIIMVDTNLQREKILPSEKAFAYKMKMDAMKRQGARTDLTSRQPGTDVSAYRTDATIAGHSDDSARQVQRHIRLTELIPPILDMVDDDRIKFNPAVELSFLSEANQRILHDIMEADQCTPSHSQAIRMKQAEVGGYLNEENILAIMQEEKGNQIAQIKIPQKSIERFFPDGVKSKDAVETIVKALEYYRAHEGNREINDDFERSRDR